MYAAYRVEPRQPVGPARTIDHALILADVIGPGRYEVLLIGDVLEHLCFVTSHEDGTFTLDPTQAGGLMKISSDAPTGATEVTASGGDSNGRVILSAWARSGSRACHLSVVPNPGGEYDKVVLPSGHIAYIHAGDMVFRCSVCRLEYQHYWVSRRLWGSLPEKYQGKALCVSCLMAIRDATRTS
jgi:hypothetical protein